MRVRFPLDSQFIHENNYRTMKISFKVDDVLPMVLQAASVVNPKSPIPILTSLVIKTRKKTGNATVTASDSNTWIDMLMPLVGEEKGDDFAFTVNSKDFVAALKNLSGKTVTLELNEESHIAKVTYDNGYFNIPYDSANDFPRPVPSTGNSVECLVDAGVLYDAISSVVFASASNLVTMPYLNGIHIDVRKDMLVAMASDFNHIVMFKDHSVHSDTDTGDGINIPNKPARIVESITKNTEGVVKLSFCDNTFSVSCMHYRVTSLLNSGNYPDFNRILPQESPISVTLLREDLLSALKRIQPMSNTASELVVFDFTEGNLNVSVEDVDFSKSAGEDIKCDYTGEGFRIGLKYSYMVSLLANLSGDNVTMKMSLSKKPVILVPESQEETREVISLVMPMLLNGEVQ